MTRIIRFIKTAGIYFLGNAFTKIISFLLIPLYTSRISPSVYGTYGLVLSLINIIVPIVYFAIWDSVFRFSFDFDKDEDKYKVMNHGFLIMVFGTFILSFVIMIIWNIVPFDNPVLICVYSISLGIQYFYTSIARSIKNNKLFVLSGCISSTVSIIINIVLIVKFNMGVTSLYISYIISVITQVIIIESKIKFIGNIKIKIEKKLLIAMLKFAVPVTISATMTWLLNGLTQVSITVQLGSYYNGLYSVANKFPTILILIISVLQFAWNEMAYDLASSNDRHIYYRKSMNELFKYSLFGVSIIILIIKVIYPVFVDHQYQDSVNIIPALLIGTTANAYAGFLGTIFMAEKESKYLYITSLLAGVINVIFQIIIVPRYGLSGAVVALAIAFIVYAIARIIMIRKKFNLQMTKWYYLFILIPVINLWVFYNVNEVYILIVIIFISFITILGLLLIDYKKIKSNLTIR